MTQHSHQTAPTQFVDAAGIRFAYRRFGESGGVPLVFNVHFTGTMDHWDPLVTDGLAATREVILFNNTGISSTSGEVPASIEEMAANAAAFIKALGLAKVDVLGFSLGGFVAQALTLAESQLVRRLVLVGTGPRGGEGMATLTREAQQIFGAPYAEPDLLWQHVHFDATETSQAAGAAFLKRFRLRRENRDPEVNEKVAPAQIEALSKWGAPREKPYEYLNAIKQPTLVINGDHDVIVYTINSYILQQNIPNAQLILYPDASHGAVPVPGALRPARLDVPVRVRRFGAFGFRIHAAPTATHREVCRHDPRYLEALPFARLAEFTARADSPGREELEGSARRC